MGILSKLFGRGKAPRSAAAIEAPPCPHVTLVPKWGNVADMGHEDKVSSFACDACHQSFTRDEGLALRASEAARLLRDVATDS